MAATDSAAEALRCPICFEPAWKAVETACCHHVFCEAHAVPGRCAFCRREDVRYEASHVARRVIENLPTSCPHECGATGLTVDTLRTVHEHECPAVEATCPAPSCTWKGERRGFAAHLAESHARALFEGAGRLFGAGIAVGGAGAAVGGAGAAPADAATAAPAPLSFLGHALPYERLFVTHRSKPKYESAVTIGSEYLLNGFQRLLTETAEGDSAWTAFSFWAVRAGTGVVKAVSEPGDMVRVRLRTGEFFAHAAADAAPGLEGIIVMHADDRVHVMLTRHVPADGLAKLREGGHWWGWHRKCEFYGQLA